MGQRADPESGSPITTDDRMTRMGTGFVMVKNLFRGHPPGEHPGHRNPFFIRVIREIRGSNSCFWADSRPPDLPQLFHGVGCLAWSRSANGVPGNEFLLSVDS